MSKILETVETYQMRTDMHREEKALTLRIRAICRRLVTEPGMDQSTITKEGDKLYEAITKDKEHPFKEIALVYTEPLFESRNVLESHRKKREKELSLLARELPAHGWVKDQKGLGELGFAMIIGEAGALDKYPNPAKLWKRMGLAVMPDGRQRKVTDKDLAKLHGYAPKRRALVWTLGDSILRTKGHYRDIYDERKAVEMQKAEDEGRIVVPAKDVKENWSPDSFRTVGHIHNRAKRYMEKRMLKDLWVAWRAEVHGDTELEAVA
jgi:hypothetical protein